jgi:hypothetical protein
VHNKLSHLQYSRDTFAGSKLRFHTPGPDGLTKCHKIHVGKMNNFCPTLEVHGTKMPEVTSESGDGSNRLNIEQCQETKGKSQILSMIENISLGKHYLKIAFFLSSILNNSEIWYRLTTNALDELEVLDRSLLKKNIFCTQLHPNCSPVPGNWMLNHQDNYKSKEAELSTVFGKTRHAVQILPLPVAEQ